MKPVRLIILCFIIAVLQLGFFAAWRPLGVVPDLLLALIIALGFYTTASETLIIGVLGGLLLDMSSGNDFGLRLSFYMVIALLVGSLNRAGLILDSLIGRLGLAAVLTIVGHGLIIASLGLRGAELPLLEIVIKVFVAVGFELIVMIVISETVRRLARRHEGLQMRGAI